MEHSKLTDEVGQALHQWSLVEMEVANLFEVTSGMPNHNAAHAAMAAIVSFEARLKVCHSVLAFFELGTLHATYWQRLYHRLLKKLKKRNELAHFSVLCIGSPGDETWRLVPYFSIGRWVLDQHTTGKPQQGLSVEQIRERALSFHQLMKDVVWFRYEMQVRLGTLSGNPLPAPDLALQLRAEGVQTREDGPRQPQS